ncbi:MAG: aldo/keto reductase [Lentisphaeria bacterium]|nr:aldo/keto reductase [Lentisphaeria bacterium]
MRLPRMKSESPDIDYAKTEALFKRAISAGVNYFDTAYFYHRGLSEKCIGDLLGRYPRNSYLLADKMPVRMLKKESDLERIWQEQLKRCKTTYFDFYLLHALNKRNWQKAKELKVYEFLMKKKEKGEIRHLGFSFHDKPEVLEDIASAFKWDFAQIQLNYYDWTQYKSKEQYEILASKNIPVIVMEPLRGGTLAKLNDAACSILKRADSKATPASWAFRFLCGLPNVLCVLSGMTEMEHLEENITTFRNPEPLTAKEKGVLSGALAAFLKRGTVACTDCRYCLPCPAGVAIPQVFKAWNNFKLTGKYSDFEKEYNTIAEDERAAECVSCMACVKKCPQQIAIPAELKRIDRETSRMSKIKKQEK